MADKKTFDFVDVNPGFSGMAFAAEAEGGVCIGVARIKPRAVPAYEDFFGRGAAARPTNPGQVILVSLPFSMFVREESGDPAVSDLIKEAAGIAKLTKVAPSIVLFRVSWSAAGRLGVTAAEYVAAVQARFDETGWVLWSVISEDGKDMFVCAVARKRWNGDAPLPASIPRCVHAGRSLNPQEILIANGYPETFALHNADIDPKLLDGIVAVGNARAALSAALASVR